MCKVQFAPVFLERRSSLFYVELDMLFFCSSVRENASHMFVPVLSSGGRRMELPSVLVAGCCRYRALRWLRWRSGRGLLRAYKIRKILKAGAFSIYYPYRVCLDYEEWMPGVLVDVIIIPDKEKGNFG